MAKKQAENSRSISPLEDSSVATSTHAKPLVFISHDTRDAELAEAFSFLLADVSAGTLKSFRSSDKRGTSGIEFGAEWYGAIMSQLDQATDVVALLTHRSIERPWILYEAGVAKGKLNTTVLGLALGVPLGDVSAGAAPFGQFQNCGDDEDSLTKLVMQLLQRNPDAAPREAAVRAQVKSFIVKKDEILSSLKTPPKKKNETEDGNIAKLFEEIKVMLRDLDKTTTVNNIAYKQDKMPLRLPSGLFEEMLMGVTKYPSQDRAAYLLILASFLREDVPWLYEPVMELYRAIARGTVEEINLAHEQFGRVMKLMARGPFEKYLFRISENGMFRTHEVFKILNMMMEYSDFSDRSSLRGKSKSGGIQN